MEEPFPSTPHPYASGMWSLLGGSSLGVGASGFTSPRSGFLVGESLPITGLRTLLLVSRTGLIWDSPITSRVLSPVIGGS